MKELSVLAIQHVLCEDLGIIADVLGSNGVGIRYIRPFRGDRIPSRINDFAALVVLGGPMGVYEQTQYPFLRREIHLLEEALNHRRPILGICLGSQLLAAALGAPVTRGPAKEIGWHPVTLSRAAAKDPLWRGQAESFTAFHWHGDIFELPDGAVSLAWSRLTECQAFRYGALAYGFLFHIEVTERTIQRMTKMFRKEILESGVKERSILEGIRPHLLPLQKIGHAVFQRWAQLVLVVKGEKESKTRKLNEPARVDNEGPIRVKRVYQDATPNDGARFLVDRLWPRGVKKTALRLDGWLKDAAPSDELRRWFAHEPAKWPEFRRRYFAELNAHPDAVRPILDVARRGPVTLLFSASDAQHNNAAALREYLDGRLVENAKPQA